MLRHTGARSVKRGDRPPTTLTPGELAETLKWKGPPASAGKAARSRGGAPSRRKREDTARRDDALALSIEYAFLAGIAKRRARSALISVMRSLHERADPIVDRVLGDEALKGIYLAWVRRGKRGLPDSLQRAKGTKRVEARGALRIPAMLFWTAKLRAGLPAKPLERRMEDFLRDAFLRLDPIGRLDAPAGVRRALRVVREPVDKNR
jgi:hypothetical protein